MDNLHVLIFAGGGGTRLWPLSREKKPKQFLKLFSDKTLLQHTFDRVSSVVPPERIYVVTTSKYAKKVGQGLPLISSERIIIEPERRGTAPAAFLGTVLINMKDPNAVVAMVWADHKILDVEEYAKALLTGTKVTNATGGIVTVGIKPGFPHTGLGYIKVGKNLDGDYKSKVFSVKQFIEKPEFERASQILEEGSCLWNVGLYIAQSKVLLDAFEKYTPEITEHKKEVEKAVTRKDAKSLKKMYQGFSELSIDKAISENINNLYVVEGKFDWSDVGDFEVLWSVASERDSEGNVMRIKDGKTGVAIQSKENLFISETGQIIAAYGVEGITVVATKDAILVISKCHSQKVKDIIAELKEKGKEEYL